MPISSDAISGDLLVASNFELDCGGVIQGFFTNISGFTDNQEVVEQKLMAQGTREVIRKIPGRYEGGEITLKRPITQNMDIWAWRKLVEDGKVSDARTNGSIVAYSQEGAEVARWNFTAGWPSKVETDSLDSGGSAITQETVTIVFESFIRVS